MPYTMNAEGQLVGDDGAVVEINGEAVTVTGAKSQAEMDAAFAKSNKAHKAKLDGLTATIKTLSEQVEKSADTEKLLADLQTEKMVLESKLGQAEAHAASEVATQLDTANKKASENQAAYEAERDARVKDQVRNVVLGAAGARFNKPALDVVPHLLSVHTREPIKDETGKATGEFSDTFKMTFDKEGKPVTEDLSIDKALKVWGEQNPHHLAPSKRRGTGGGEYSQSGASDKPDGLVYPSMEP